MKLIDYVSGILQPISSAQPQLNWFPDSLELPSELIKLWLTVYELGERMACEWGQSLTLQAGQIKRSKLVKGISYGCSIPVDKGNDLEFGDMHCHPSLSIGHMNGYCSHSIQDWMVFKDHTKKPVFIRFVVSSDYLYAVVYRKGVSGYIETSVKSNWGDRTKKEDEYAARFKLKGPAMGEVSDDADPAELAKEQLEKKKQTPGYGEAMMKVAGLFNVELANKLRFGFYMGHRNKNAGLLNRLSDKWSVDPNEQWNNYIYAVAMSRGLL